MPSHVQVELHGGIATVTLHDPDRLNAMSQEMGVALADAVDSLSTREDLRVVVLTGTPPAFSAGGDLGMIEELARRAREEGHDATAFMEAFYRGFLSVGALPVPVIAAINGHAIGAGCCVALACDIRLVAADAKVGVNFVTLGLHPGMGSTWFLPRILGPERAAEWLYSGRLLVGEEAARQGLASRALPAPEVLPAAMALAADIAAAAPLAIRQLKASLRATTGSTLDDQLRREASAQAVDYRTADLIEGMAAVRERRPARFTGA